MYLRIENPYKRKILSLDLYKTDDSSNFVMLDKIVALHSTYSTGKMQIRVHSRS